MRLLVALICVILITSPVFSEIIIGDNGYYWLRYSDKQKYEQVAFYLIEGAKIYKVDRNKYDVKDFIEKIDNFYIRAAREFIDKSYNNPNEGIKTPVGLLVYDLLQPQHKIIDINPYGQ